MSGRTPGWWPSSPCQAAQKLEEKVREQEQTAAGVGLRMRIHAESGARASSTTSDGQAVEERITAVTFAAATPGPSFNMATGEMGQRLCYNCGGYLIFALRAPQGQLQAKEKFFDLVLATVQLDPAWEGRVTQVLVNMQAADSKGARDRSAIIAQNQKDIGNIINQTDEKPAEGAGRLRGAVQPIHTRRGDLQEPSHGRDGRTQQPVRPRVDEQRQRVHPDRFAGVRPKRGSQGQLDRSGADETVGPAARVTSGLGAQEAVLAVDQRRGVVARRSRNRGRA